MPSRPLAAGSFPEAPSAPRTTFRTRPTPISTGATNQHAPPSGPIAQSPGPKTPPSLLTGGTSGASDVWARSKALVGFSIVVGVRLDVDADGMLSAASA